MAETAELLRSFLGRDPYEMSRNATLTDAKSLVTLKLSEGKKGIES